MIVKLTEIVEIKTGITFRNRLLDNLDGEVEVIQMKDVDENCMISRRLMRIGENLVKSRHLLQPGQIILLAKGKSIRACLIREPDRKQVISSAFSPSASNRCRRFYRNTWSGISICPGRKSIFRLRRRARVCFHFP